jgi:hypothetical protein
VQLEDEAGDPIDEETIYNHALAEHGVENELLAAAEALGELQQLCIRMALNRDETGNQLSVADRDLLRRKCVNAGLLIGTLRELDGVDEGYTELKKRRLEQWAMTLGLIEDK